MVLCRRIVTRTISFGKTFTSGDYSWLENSLLCELFVVEGKMIVIGSFKYSPFSFENGSDIYPLVPRDAAQQHQKHR
jgi:hypothetical protein